MPTTCLPPPSLYKLLLLSACTLVACSMLSTASSVSNGQPDRYSNMTSETVPNEEKTLSFVADSALAVQNVAKRFTSRFYSNKNPNIDSLFLNNDFLKMDKPYFSPVFMEIAAEVLNKDPSRPRKHAINELFQGLVRAKADQKNRIRAEDFNDLVRQIESYKSLTEQPIHPVPVAPGKLANNAIVDTDQLREIVLDLQDPLFRFWKSKGVTVDQAYTLLKVDAQSLQLFTDPNVLLWIDFVRYDRPKDTFELVLKKFREKSLDDFDLAIRLSYADAEKHPGTVAHEMLMALFDSWTAKRVKPKELVHRLVPDIISIDVEKGPLKLWVEYFRPKLKEKLYPTLADALVNPIDSKLFMKAHVKLFMKAYAKLFMKAHASTRQHDREQALVDLISLYWENRFDKWPKMTERRLASSLEYSIIAALCERWKQQSMTPTQLWQFLRIDKLMKFPTLMASRRRVWLMFVVNNKNVDRQAELMEKPLTDEAMVEVIARLVDWDKELYGLLRDFVYNDWNAAKKTKADVLDLVMFPHKDRLMFLKRELVVWYNYQFDPDVDRVKQISQMRKDLMARYEGSKFESDLNTALGKVDGELHHILSELLAVDKGMQASPEPFLSRLPAEVKLDLPQPQERIRHETLPSSESVPLEDVAS